MWKEEKKNYERQNKRETWDTWNDECKHKHKKDFASRERLLSETKLLKRERGAGRKTGKEQTWSNGEIIDSCNEQHSIALIGTIAAHLAKSLTGLHESGAKHPSALYSCFPISVFKPSLYWELNSFLLSLQTKCLTGPFLTLISP